jgi:hypothetical protein
MRNRRRHARGLATTLLALVGCGYGSAVSTHPADAPPRSVVATPQPGTVVSLYDGYNAVGVHEVYVDRGWRSRFVSLPEPADDLAVLDETRWAVAYGGSGRVVLIDGDAEPTELAAFEPAPLRVVSGDLDSDGHVDVVVASDGPAPAVHLVFGSPSGFSAPRHVPLSPKGRTTPSLLLADLDREGSLDVLAGVASGRVGDPIPDHLRVFRNTTHGKLSDEWTSRVRSPSHLHAADFDDDGLPDVLATGPQGAWLNLSSGFGWLDTPEKLSRGEFAGGALQDVDGDGRVDIVLLRADTKKVEIRPGVGAGRTAPVQRYDVGEGPISLALVERDEQTLIVTANATDKSFTTVRAARRRSR